MNIIWSSVRERQRVTLLRSQLLAINGTGWRQGAVRHLVAQHLQELTPLLGELATKSRDFKVMASVSAPIGIVSSFGNPER